VRSGASAVGFRLVGFLGGQAAGEAAADDVASEPALLLGECVDSGEGVGGDAHGDLGSGCHASECIPSGCASGMQWDTVKA
jgi:hypothetical protein